MTEEQKERQRAYNREYWLRNREKLLQYHREYYHTNKKPKMEKTVQPVVIQQAVPPQMGFFGRLKAAIKILTGKEAAENA